MIPPSPHKYPWPDASHLGIYGGLSGTASVLIQIYKNLKIEKAKIALDEIFAYIKSEAKSDENGIFWTKSPVTLADGGILLFLASFYENFPNDEVKEFLEKAGKAYLSLGIAHNDGSSLEFSDFQSQLLAEPDYKYKVSQPNFELGSAGAGFILTRLFEVLKDEKYLSAAKKVENYLDSIKIPQKNGFLIPYRVGNDPSEAFFYLGNCHGAAGTVKFYYNLYKTSGEKKYLEKASQLFDGFKSLGAPSLMSKGFWNNTSVCCGHAGVLNSTIGLFTSTKDENWLGLAQKSAEILYGEYEENENVRWPIAYRRVVPTDFSYTIFYNDGTAGIATALLRYYMAKTGISHTIPFADDPFGEH